MNNTSFKSYKLKIFQHTKHIQTTINIYQNLIHFLINIYAKEKELFKNLNSKEQLKLMERLIHKTDKNSPKYKEYHNALMAINKRICDDLDLYYDTNFNLIKKKK